MKKKWGKPVLTALNISFTKSASDKDSTEEQRLIWHQSWLESDPNARAEILAMGNGTMS